MKRILFLLLCAGFYAGCDSVAPSDIPGATEARRTPAAAFAEAPADAGDVDIRRGGPGRAECACTRGRGGPLTLDTTLAAQVTFTREIGGRDVTESYVLVLKEANERQVVLALYRLRYVVSLCEVKDFTAYRLVRNVRLVPRRGVAVEEIASELTWNGRLGTSPNGGVAVTFHVRPLPPAPASTKDPRVPTEPPPKDWFLCVVPKGLAG